jgi:thioredoxin 1
MKNNILNNTDLLVRLGALIVIVGISLGAASNPGSDPRLPEGQKDTDTQKNEEINMPSATKQKGRVYRADEANFAELVLNSDVPVLVDFYADWCGPCRMLAPVLEELAKETNDAKIVKVNVDESPRLAARYKIASIPSLRVFEDGEVVNDHVGLASKAKLEKMLGI